MKLDGVMLIQKHEFQSKTSAHLKKSIPKEDIDVYIDENMRLVLNNVVPAEKEWPEINQPITLLYTNTS